MDSPTARTESMVSVATDREDAVYDLGDMITFRISGPANAWGRGKLPYALWTEAGGEVQNGEVSRRGSVGEVCVPAREPGFVHLRLDLMGQECGCPEAVAAVSPEQIAPSLPTPADFDEFWAGELDAMRSSPPDHRTSPHLRGGVEILRVVISMPEDRDVHAWLLRPSGPGPFPVVIRFHGSGVYPVPPTNGLDWAERGAMVLSVNPHSIPNDREAGFYEELRLGPLADYRTQGRNDRKTVYFREMFLRGVRSADYITEHRDWDGFNMVVEGHSQGGGQAIALAGLHDRVSAVVASHPTHCDHTGIVIGRVVGWPRIVEVHGDIPDHCQVQAARYVDAVNFASQVRCPAFFCVGFMDDLCPPTGVFAAYNSIKSHPKTILQEPKIGHFHTENCRSATHEWVSGMIF